MNKNVVVSQRLKLAAMDLELNPDLNEVLYRVIAQDRKMTMDEIQAEALNVKQLYRNSRAAVAGMANMDNAGQFFKAKVLGMKLSEDELTAIAARAATELLKNNASDQVAPGGFLPEDKVLELEQLVEYAEDDASVEMTQERMMDLLVYSLTQLSLIALQQPRTKENAKQGNEEIENTAEDSLAVKSIMALSKAGEISEYWLDFDEEQIAQVIRFVRNDASARESNEHLIGGLIDQLTKGYVTARSEQKTTIYEMDEADLECRHLLAIAAVLNLKATNQLEGGMEEMSDKDLALTAYAATQMNYYYDQAASGKLTVEDFMHLGTDLFGILFYTCIAVLYFSASAINVITVLGGAFIVVAVLCFVYDAVDRILNKLYPAGVSETRLGRVIKATRRDVARFVARVKGKISDRIKALQPVEASVPATCEWEDEAEEEETETEETEEYALAY